MTAHALGDDEVAELFDEIGVAIAGVELDAEDKGLTGEALGARNCLRAVAKIRERVLRVGEEQG